MRPSAMNSIQHTHTSRHTHTQLWRESERCSAERARERGLCKYSAAAAAAAVEQVATTLMLQCETFEKFYKSRWTRRRAVGHLTVPQNDSGVAAVVDAAIAAMLAVVRLHLELETSLVPRHWKSESTFFYCSRRFIFFSRLLCMFVHAGARVCVFVFVFVRALVHWAGSLARVTGARLAGKWTFWRFNLLVGASTSTSTLAVCVCLCETSLLRLLLSLSLPLPLLALLAAALCNFTVRQNIIFEAGEARLYVTTYNRLKQKQRAKERERGEERCREK